VLKKSAFSQNFLLTGT
jgi:hypothetical protein